MSSEQIDRLDDDDDGEMEQQFQNAYDEVVALKRLLQDLLNVERSGALDPEDPDDIEAALPLGSDDCDYSDDYGGYGDEGVLDEHLQADPIECAAPGSESGLSDHALSPARVMCFSDELRSFTPPTLALDTATTDGRRDGDGSKNNNSADQDDDNDENCNEEHEPPLHTHTPRASRSSLKLLRASATFEPNFQARMRQFVAQNRQKKEQIRLAVCEQEDVCLQPTPTINRRSKRINRSVSHLMAWNYEKESKLAHLRQAEAARESAEVVGKPAIARRSTALFAQRNDEFALCRVEDRLQLLGLIYKYQQEERLLSEHNDTGASHPRVAPHSANLARKATAPLAAHERLYQLAMRRAKHRDTGPSRSDNQAEPSSPSHRERATATAPSAATVQRLWAFGAEYEKKLQAQRELQRLRAARLHDTPKLSKTSRKLAQRRGERQATAAQQSQPRDQQQPLQHARCMCCRREPNAPTHAPTCRVGATRARAIFAKQVQWKRAIDAKDAQLKRFYDDLARTECTFKNPHAAPTGAWQTSAAAHRGDANTAFFERTMAWATKREKRLAHEKKVWEEIHLTECTFQPQLSPRKRPAGAPSRVQSVWSPGKGVVVSDSGLSSPALRCPVSPYGCSSTASRRYASSPRSPLPRQWPPVTPSTFARLIDSPYDALDLEALAATTPSSGATSSPRSRSGR